VAVGAWGRKAVGAAGFCDEPSSSAWQVITSSAHNQEALDFLSDKRGISEKDDKHSPFAEALFEALQDGEPDKKGNRYKKADLTKDGVITAPELYLYLRDNVETRSRERQTPGLFPLKRHDRGEYIFHDPNFDPTTLSEAPELDEANNRLLLGGFAGEPDASPGGLNPFNDPAQESVALLLLDAHRMLEKQSAVLHQGNPFSLLG